MTKEILTVEQLCSELLSHPEKLQSTLMGHHGLVKTNIDFLIMLDKCPSLVRELVDFFISRDHDKFFSPHLFERYPGGVGAVFENNPFLFSAIAHMPEYLVIATAKDYPGGLSALLKRSSELEANFPNMFIYSGHFGIDPFFSLVALYPGGLTSVFNRYPELEAWILTNIVYLFQLPKLAKAYPGGYTTLFCDHPKFLELLPNKIGTVDNLCTIIAIFNSDIEGMLKFYPDLKEQVVSVISSVDSSGNDFDSGGGGLVNVISAYSSNLQDFIANFPELEAKIPYLVCDAYDLMRLCEIYPGGATELFRKYPDLHARVPSLVVSNSHLGWITKIYPGGAQKLLTDYPVLAAKAHNYSNSIFAKQHKHTSQHKQHATVNLS